MPRRSQLTQMHSRQCLSDSLYTASLFLSQRAPGRRRTGIAPEHRPGRPVMVAVGLPAIWQAIAVPRRPWWVSSRCPHSLQWGMLLSCGMGSRPAGNAWGIAFPQTDCISLLSFIRTGIWFSWAWSRMVVSHSRRGAFLLFWFPVSAPTMTHSTGGTTAAGPAGLRTGPRSRFTPSKMGSMLTKR